MMEKSNQNMLDDHLHLYSKECAEAEKQESTRCCCCSRSFFRAWNMHVD